MELSAACDRDPQRRDGRRQPDYCRRGLGTADTDPDAPGVSVRPLSVRGGSGQQCPSRIQKQHADISPRYGRAMLRRYPTAEAYINEVSKSRLLTGVDYRFSLDAGKAME